MSSHQTHQDHVLCQEKIREDNLAARRAAAEAVSISRETLQTTVAQGEQLQHCENLQERNRYIVTKSARIIRGMTWSGWMMNMFSKDTEPPPENRKLYNQSDDDDDIFKLNLPQEIQDFASIVRNYEFNVKLLDQCDNEHDFDTCLEICDSLRLCVQQALEDLTLSSSSSSSSQEYKMMGNEENNVHTTKSIKLRLQKKFIKVKQLQQSIIQQKNSKFKGTRQILENNEQQQQQQQESKISSSKNVVTSLNPKKIQLWANTNDDVLKERILHQEEHINALQENITELLRNGISMGVSLEQQNQLLDKLDVGADELREETKMITRRADRLSHRSLWRKPPKDFQYRVAFQHVTSQQFLSIEPHNKNKLSLHKTLHPDMSVFDIYERRGSKLIGIQNKCTGTWLGLSLLGYVVCNSNKFGNNEEWELDDEPMNKTRILCASAHWGNGGWLEFDAKTETFLIGDYGLDSKKNAALWSIIILSNNANDDNDKRNI
mmetsp:Transcript_14618/g.27485  ORF Transcript_14618/g.27485 Transcript_14618/m.27485 type:complete len:491 (+) Transcript_14618:56-1528(+)